MSSVEAFHLFRIAREEAAERLLMPTAAVRRLSHGFGFCPKSVIRDRAVEPPDWVATDLWYSSHRQSGAQFVPNLTYA